MLPFKTSLKSIVKLNLFEILLGNSFAAHKAAMAILTPINVGPPRLPLSKLNNDVIDKLRHALGQYS